MMKRSFLYRLHSHGLRPGVQADPTMFQEAFRSKYGKVRIFKILGVSEESKNWVADPANKKCDVPGSWFCPGQYPPGLNYFLSRKKDFAQLEDFNKKGTGGDDDYQKQYFQNLNNPEYARQMAQHAEAAKSAETEKTRKVHVKTRQFEVSSEGTEEINIDSKENAAPDKEMLDQVYRTYEDTEETTRMWHLISSGNVDEIKAWIEVNLAAAYIRSKDGRGPMWWAFESHNEDIVKVLTNAGVPHTDADIHGKTPVDLLSRQEQ